MSRNMLGSDNLGSGVQSISLLFLEFNSHLTLFLLWTTSTLDPDTVWFISCLADLPLWEIQWWRRSYLLCYFITITMETCDLWLLRWCDESYYWCLRYFRVWQKVWLVARWKNVVTLVYGTFYLLRNWIVGGNT